MIHQIERLSPHQNAKVLAVLMALGSLVFFVPFFIFAFASAPAQAQAHPSIWLFALMPLIYLVFGYLMVAIGCWLYNTMFRFVGGIEYTSRSEAS